ncbi:histone-like nucleoid-structuring protein Lsr2 [Janibacter anophelis]
MDDFLIARNPEQDSTLPYLVRISLGDGVVLKAKDVWPRTSKLYCHRTHEWPEDAEIIERVATRSCSSRGAAIDLVLDRRRESRSQFVMTRIRGGRPAIFWQTARTTKQARPNVDLPTARAQGVADLPILVDSHERYPWRFTHQQAVTERRGLPAGDYAVTDGDRIVAAVERKSLADLVSSLTSGKLTYLLAELSDLPRAAVVVEDRYAQVFALDRVRPAVVAEAIAECQARFPAVPIFFAENRQLAQEWTYRFLAAAREELRTGPATGEEIATMAAGNPAPPSAATPGEIREWAREHGWTVSDRGRIPTDVRRAFEESA